jgi:hypothetical protein
VLEPLLEQEFAFEPAPGLAFEPRLEDEGEGWVSVTQQPPARWVEVSVKHLALKQGLMAARETQRAGCPGLVALLTWKLLLLVLKPQVHLRALPSLERAQLVSPE